jgi:hypothetical protein
MQDPKDPATGFGVSALVFAAGQQTANSDDVERT